MELIYKSATLIYSSFDKNGRIPNGYDIYDNGNMTYFDGSGYFVTHLNDPYDVHDMEHPTENRKIKINISSLDNLNPNGANFYIIAHPNVNYDDMSTDIFKFPQQVIDKIKDNNLYLTLLNEHESCSEEDFINLCKKIESDGIPLSRVILLNNNSKLYSYKKKHGYDIIVHHSNFLYFSFIKTLKLLNSKYTDIKSGKFFMCRNKNPKPHRIALLANLKMNDLLNEINYSFLPKTDFNFDNYFLIEKFFKNNLDENLIQSIISNPKEDDFEYGKNWINFNSGEFTHHSDFEEIYHIPEHSISFENSYFNIVTESSYDSELNSIHITEKSLRPFYFYQFPIFVSTPHHIKYLKKDFDFDFFDDVIDHSYDSEIDDKKRMDMIISEIKRINQNKQFFIDFYKKNKKRFEHNRNVCIDRSFSGKTEDLNFFWNLL